MRAWSATLLMVAVVLAPSCGGGEGEGGDSPGGTPAVNYEQDVRTAADAVWTTLDRLEERSNVQRLQQELDGASEEINAAVTRIEQTAVPNKALDANQRLLSGLWYTRDAIEDARLTISDPGNPLPEAELARADDGLSDARAALKELEELGYDTRRPR